MAVLFGAASPCAAADWLASISTGGVVRLDFKDDASAIVAPGLFESGWKSAAMSEGQTGQRVQPGLYKGELVAQSGKVVDVETRVASQDPGLRVEYRLMPRESMSLNGFHVNVELPTQIWSGGEFLHDGVHLTLPAKYSDQLLWAGPVGIVGLTSADDRRFSLQIDGNQRVMLQDDRQWGETFSLRIGPLVQENQEWPAGKTLTVGFTILSSAGVGIEQDQPVTILAGDDWIPLDTRVGVLPGSALDLSRLVRRHKMAGEHGRVIVNDAGKFAFESQPAEATRFYGINLCFSSQYVEHETADRLADRLSRMGYNSVRIHHYEGDLIDRSSVEGVRLRPDRLDQLDYLMAAFKNRGIYVTTDLYVSRPVPRSVVYPGETGDMGMDEYKMAVSMNERAYKDYQDFAGQLLNHVNPYTNLRYADDPMLAWLSLVNENCPGNFIAQLEGSLRGEWQAAWNRWLLDRYKSRSALESALGELPDDQDPANGTVPLQDVYAKTPLVIQFNTFLASVEKAFFVRTRQWLRDEIGCKALLTDMNAWTNPIQMQAVRTEFDYVDDHFYVDHPEFLERPWSLPSRCPNTSPLLEGARGGRNTAFTRLINKPFTLTEYNYSSPGRFRGVGGILTGALGAVQDWDGIWRFSYAHSREAVEQPTKLNYFDVSADPLNMAAERASLCLFLREDLSPASSTILIKSTVNDLLTEPTSSRDKTPGWNGLAWVTKVGWILDSSNKKNGFQVSLPLDDPNIGAFSKDIEKRILATLKAKAWSSPNNLTDFAQNRFQTDDGQLLIDAPENRLVLNTSRTAGGFAPAGKSIQTEAVKIDVEQTDATVWVSSLNDEVISSSDHLLITHLTDLQNTETVYGDQKRKVLMDWGRLPHLVQAGKANVRISHPNADKATVYLLATDGERVKKIDAMVGDGELTVPLTINHDGKAFLLYEVVFDR